MKGLLLKDWYMTVKYCRSYLLIVGVFIAVQAFSPNYFYAFYAGIMAGLIPVTLISYDERSKWTVYSCALPYTRAQLVSAKYIVGGAAQLAAMVVMGTVQAVKLCAAGSFSLGGFAGFLALQLFMSSIICSINLPFVFKFGVEKGRISYYVIIIASFAVIGAIGGVAMISGMSAGFNYGILSPVFLAVGIGAYALSWLLSVKFYSKRELG